MKASKDSLRTARGLFRVSLADGRMDIGRVKKIIEKLKTQKPRGYLSILSAFGRMIRLELEKSHAVVESAAKLDDGMREQITKDLKEKYGDDLTSEFADDKTLVGGLRIRVGSDVWDGSVKARLSKLGEVFSK